MIQLNPSIVITVMLTFAPMRESFTPLYRLRNASRPVYDGPPREAGRIWKRTSGAKVAATAALSAALMASTKARPTAAACSGAAGEYASIFRGSMVVAWAKELRMGRSVREAGYDSLGDGGERLLNLGGVFQPPAIPGWARWPPSSVRSVDKWVSVCATQRDRFKVPVARTT